jgi:hypothetical protein
MSPRLAPALPASLVCLAVLASPSARAAPDADVTGVVHGRGCPPLWDMVDPRAPAPALPGGCDPAHEKLLLLALRRARLVSPQVKLDSPELAEYLQGLLWSDDPGFEGAKWPAHFLDVEKKALAGKRFGPGDDLLGRVHFGDLQPLHGLAAVYGQNAYDTFDDVIRWVEFLYEVAAGRIPPSTPLAQQPVEGIRKRFPRGPATVGALFGGGDTARRAAGALVHLVQDVFLPGHAVRVQAEGVTGGIRAYNSNQKLAADRHRSDPGWRELWKDGASAFAVKGGRDALLRCTDVLALVQARREWAVAREYVEVQVLSLSGVKKPERRAKQPSRR